MNKNKIFYIVIFILLTSFIYLFINFELKIWIFWGIVPLVIWIINKDVITGNKWFPKKESMKSSNSLKTQKTLEQIITELPKLKQIEKEGYIELSELCCSKEVQKKVIPFLEDLKDFSNEEEYLTTLNFVMEYLDNNNIFFIMSLDWKQDVETLKWRIENSLQNNFNLFVELPDLNNYSDRTSVSFDNVFEDFDKPLRKKGKQIGFIDTKSDEYVIIIHEIIDREKIIETVSKIGYNYFDK